MRLTSSRNWLHLCHSRAWCLRPSDTAFLDPALTRCRNMASWCFPSDVQSSPWQDLIQAFFPADMPRSKFHLLYDQYYSKDTFLKIWSDVGVYSCNAQMYRSRCKEFFLFGSLAYGHSDTVSASTSFHSPTPPSPHPMFSTLPWLAREKMTTKTTSDQVSSLSPLP